jgi:hypothetical protein
LTRYQIVRAALGNFRSGLLLLAHKSPIANKPRRPVQDVAV